ncbi:LysR substrate-binding domain-containing protein [Pelomonas sp. KK5]|uniref:LysR substrate-binding domain-containing protein n=1 Tax=Pelomonas sp. KK5 TaxID=1855730 RepID=UPI00097BC69C|nr:LysR substrate-binding domain-containing protein [Pelomonas sp. KK5]
MAKNGWELIDLRVLCAVAQRASFTAAATDLGVSVAYVTKRIAQLEKVLGSTLFLRTTRRVSITTQGEAVFGWARRVLEAAAELDQEVAQARGALAGRLRISTSYRLGSQHIAPIVALLRKAHPGLDVWLDLVDRRVDLIAEGFDIDIRVGEVQEPHLVAHRMAASSRILCAAPSYLRERGRPATLAELSQQHEGLMFRDRDRPFTTLKLQGPQGEESVHLGGSMGSNQSDVVRRWAEEGLGIALLSQWDLAEALRAGRLEQVLPQYHQPADIVAAVPTRSGQSARLQVCLQFLREQLAAGAHALDFDLPPARA